MHLPLIVCAVLRRGFIDASARLTPCVGHSPAIDPTVYYAYGYHGTGVSTGVWAGQQLARLMTGKMSMNDLPVTVRGEGARAFWPFPQLRVVGLRAALAVYRWRDERD
jgi:hypothetical protein